MSLQRRQVYRTFFSPSPFTSAQRRWFRKTTVHWSDVAFWLTVVATIALGYVWSSTECAMGRECLIANADLAKWLFGKK